MGILIQQFDQIAFMHNEKGSAAEPLTGGVAKLPLAKLGLMIVNSRGLVQGLECWFIWYIREECQFKLHRRMTVGAYLSHVEMATDALWSVVD